MSGSSSERVYLRVWLGVWRLNRWMESPKCDVEREDVLFQTLGDQQTSSALLESVPAAALRGRSNRVILSLIDIFLETQ